MRSTLATDDVAVVSSHEHPGRLFEDAVVSALDKDDGAPRVTVVGQAAARNVDMHLPPEPYLLALTTDGRLQRHAVAVVKVLRRIPRRRPGRHA